MTTTDLAHLDDSSITLLPPRGSAAENAVAMLREHANLMSMAFDLADKMCATKLVPTRFFRKPEDGTAAILYGLELGLNPIQSLQRVIPIHGMPTLESLTMVALLEARGYTIKTVEETEAVCEVHGWKPGRDPDTDDPDATSRWTIERAIKARYVPQPSSPESKCRPEVDEDWVTVTKTWEGKTRKSVVGNMKYITDPQAMLVAKCQARVCKAIGSSVLLGIGGSTEEMQSEQFDGPAPSSVQSERSPAPRGAVTADEILGTVDPEPAPAKPKRERPAGTRARKSEPKQEPQDAEVVDAPADNAAEPETSAAEPKPEPAQVSASDSGEKVDTEADSPADAPTEDLRKKARGKLTGAIFSMFGEVGLSDEKNREDRLVVIEAIVGRPVKSSNDLTDDELQNLRNSLYSRSQAGTLDADVNDWLNLAAVREADAREAAEAAAQSATEEGN